MLRVLLLTLVATLCVCQDYDHVPDFEWDEETSLDEYVFRDDGYWTYNLLDTVHHEKATVYVLNMTSQKWMDESYSSHSVWWHWMVIAVPFELRTTEHATMAIIGGSNRDPDDPPGEGDTEVDVFAQMANDTGVVSSYIAMVPNQPITFTNDPEQRSRTEDAIIAWTWRTYLDDPDKPREVILRHPMTKAAKRGLDTIADFMKEIDPETDIDKFFISGGSKRGWTTWSLGAVDPRVVGMIPLVFSLLNIDETIMAHYQALEGWSFTFKDYYEVNLTLELHNPRTQDIWDSEDVFRFRSRMTMPKFAVGGTGDEFFLNQDNHYWFTGMPQPFYHYMISNAEHTLLPHYLKIYDCIAAFVISVVDDIDFPETFWEMGETEDGGWIRYETDPPPRIDDDGNMEVKAMRAVTLQNSTARDYRLAAGYPDTWINPVRWYEDDLEVVDDGVFYHETDQVEGDWVGHLIEGIWDGPGDHRIYLTTQVNIVPGTFPMEECYGEECYGELV